MLLRHLLVVTDVLHRRRYLQVRRVVVLEVEELVKLVLERS